MAPLERATRRYLFAFALLIACSSAWTFRAAWQGADAHPGRGLLLALSGLEVLAALGFLLRRWRLIFGVLLTLIFTLAALLHALEFHDVPAALLVYLATTLYLMNATRSGEASWG